MPDVADMKVVVDGDVKGLETAMGRAKAAVSGFEGSTLKTLQSVDSNLTKLAGGWFGLAKAIPVVGAAAAAIALVGSQYEKLEELRKSTLGAATALQAMSKETDISARNLQILAAAFAGVEEEREKMDGGLKAFVETMKKARDGDGDAAAGFKALGVSLVDVDGKQRSHMAILRDVIEELKKTEDETYRLRVATILFGEDAADAWIKVAEKGKEGLAEVAKAAEKNGKIMSDATIQAMADADRQLTEFLESGRSKLDMFTGYWGAAMKTLGRAMLDVLGRTIDNPNLISIVNLENYMVSLFENIHRAKSKLAELTQELERLRGFGDAEGGSVLAAKRSALDAEIKRIQDEIARTTALYEQAQGILSGKGKPAAEEKPAAHQPIVKLPDLPGTGAKGEADPLAWLARQVREMERYATTLGLTAGEAAKLKAEEEGIQRLRERGLDVTPELEERVKKYAEALRIATDRTNDLKQTMADLRESGQIMARGIESAFTNWMQTGKFNSKEMVRSILQDLAKLALQVSILRPLFGGGVGGGGGLFGKFFGGLLIPGYGGGGAGGGLDNANVARAFGGPAMAGREYMVGELGPEKFRPAIDGMILPASQSRGDAAMSSVMNVSINAAGADPAGLARVERAVQDLNRTFEKRVRASQHREQVRGVRAS